MKKIKIAFVGCGKVANHYKSLMIKNPISNIQVIAACDKNISVAKEFSKEFCENFYDDLEKMIEENKIDLAIVCSPSGMHYLQTKKIIEKGINAIVEKPLTLTVKQSEVLNNLAKEKKVLLNVAFQNRLNPAVKALKKAFSENRFGKIVTSTVRLRWCREQEYYNDEWHGKWLNDGGVINQQAIHHIDAFNWIVGPVDKVCSLSANRLNRLEAEDTFTAVLKLKNGGLGTIEATTAARPEDFEASISVVGEKGMVEVGGIALNEIKKWKFVNPIQSDKNAIKNYSIEVPNGFGLSHLILLKDLTNILVNSEKKDVVSAEDSIKTTQLIHALYKSDETKSWINLDDNPVSSRLGKDN
jgi:UDP-N-acetyl-2-amino-2-deoxyglucuronate dehydrogenase